METLGDLDRRTDDGAPALQDRPPKRSWAGLIESLDPPSDFNFLHFRMRHMAAELIRSLRPEGVLPGQQAPSFELDTTHGGRLRLRDLCGRPVLVHFVSYT
jgi:hypothetical protein